MPSVCPGKSANAIYSQLFLLSTVTVYYMFFKTNIVLNVAVLTKSVGNMIKHDITCVFVKSDNANITLPLQTLLGNTSSHYWLTVSKIM